MINAKSYLSHVVYISRTCLCLWHATYISVINSILMILVMFSVKMNPLTAFELLFFAVFGQTTYDELIVNPRQQNSNQPYIQNQKPDRPDWTTNLFKVVFGIYMLVSVVVLINLLIAMMSDTYQRIQVTPFIL